MYLVNMGVSRRKFYRDRFLYRFGANEDIPEGFLVEFTQGLRNRELSNLWYYSGLRVAGGRHFDHFGYMSGSLGYGSFYDMYSTKAGVASAEAFYFSDLLQHGEWFFRQFTRFRIMHGISRLQHERITLNGNQMYGFSSPELSGRTKLILNFEFVTYAPYKLLGFRFAPVLLAGFGKIGNDQFDALRSRVYQSYALGILVRNEYLISSTFEVTIGFFPFMPGYSDNAFRLNPFSSYTVKARDYFIGRPELVAYE
jgi:hypothetical protein